jgi:HK97 family phage portal protein
MVYSPFATVKRTPPTTKARPVLPMMYFEGGEWRWSFHDSFEDYAKDGYERNAIIHMAIAYKQRALAQAPLRPFEGNFQQYQLADMKHPSWAWCLRPNEHQSGMEFMQQAICYLDLSGNNYIFIDKGRDGTIKALHNLRPDRVKLAFKQGKFLGYYYVPEGRPLEDGIPILPNYMMHIKYPNPRDPYEGQGYGLSPIMPMAQPADVDNFITKFLHKYFSTGITTLGALVSQRVVSQADRAVYRDMWMEMYGGVDNWARPMFLDEGMDWKPFQPPFKDIDFGVIDRRGEARLLGPLGVNGILLGLPGAMERSTYNNIREVQRDFWETTFNPQLLLFQVEFINMLTSADGVFPMFDTSDVPALQRDLPPMVDSSVKLIQVGMPPYIAYQTVGLKVQRYPGDEIARVPLSLQPVGTPAPALPNTTPQSTPEEETPEDEGGMEEVVPEDEEVTQADDPLLDLKTWTPEEKAIIWKAQDNLARSYEGAFAEAAYAQFKRDHAEIEAILNQQAEKSRRQKATVNWLDSEILIDNYINSVGLPLWRRRFYPLQSALANDVADFWITDLGIAFNVVNIEGMMWFQDYQLTFAQPINLTTSDDIHNLLQQGQLEGWSIESMRNALDTMFDQYMTGELTPEDFEWFNSRMPSYRKELIARTETTRLQSAGSYNLFREWGVDEKEWLAAMDDRVREAHAALNGQVKPVNEAFESPTGGHLMYPGDPASPIDGYNCRCTLLPRFPDTRARMIHLKVKELEQKWPDQ